MRSVDVGDDSLSRDIAHTLGKIEGWMESTDKRLDRMQTDLVERIGEHDRKSRAGLADLRSDVVAANGNMRGDIVNHEGRISKLESDKAERHGALKLAAFLREYSPWMVGILVAVIAYLK